MVKFMDVLIDIARPERKCNWSFVNYFENMDVVLIQIPNDIL